MAQFLPIQAQSFLLYGSGNNIGDTTLVLSSFKDIDGNTISMQGTVMTGTLEPNAGSQEEQIIFTGVTQNANGTATLTGIKSVTFASPYTQTTGFLKAHPGNSTFVLSDTSYLYSQYASLDNDQTFGGSNAFSLAVQGQTPTISGHLATKGYVDGVAISGGAKASTTVFGISELSVAPVTASVPIAVGTNDTRIPTASETLALAGVGQGNIDNTNFYVSQRGIQIGSETYALTGGSSTAYTLTLAPVPTGYVTGERIYFKAHTASGSSPTINKNSLGAKSLYKQITSGTTPLAVGDLGTNQMAIAEYDGGAYQLVSPIAKTALSNAPVYACGETSKAASDSSATQTIAHGLGKTPAFVELYCTANNSGTPGGTFIAYAFYNGTTQASMSTYTTGNFSQTSDNTFTLNTSLTSGTTVGVVTFDATNISIAWTKSGSPTGGYQILWKAVSPAS